MKNRNNLLRQDLKPKYLLMRENKMNNEIKQINQLRKTEFKPIYQTETDSTLYLANKDVLKN